MVTAAMSRQILTPSKDQAFSWINRAITSPNTVDILSTQYQLVIGDVGGECNFLSSVLPQQRFEMMDQCYSLVALWCLLHVPFLLPLPILKLKSQCLLTTYTCIEICLKPCLIQIVCFKSLICPNCTGGCHIKSVFKT